MQKVIEQMAKDHPKMIEIKRNGTQIVAFRFR